MNDKKLYVVTCIAIFFLLMLGFIPSFSCYLSWVTPPAVLLCGLFFGLFVGQPYPEFNKKVSKYLLQYAVVGLGFGMNLSDAIARGKEGMLFTIVSVFAGFSFSVLGLLISLASTKLMKKLEQTNILSSNCRIIIWSIVMFMGSFFMSLYFLVGIDQFVLNLFKGAAINKYLNNHVQIQYLTFS